MVEHQRFSYWMHYCRAIVDKPLLMCIEGTLVKALGSELAELECIARITYGLRYLLASDNCPKDLFELAKNALAALGTRLKVDKDQCLLEATHLVIAIRLCEEANKELITERTKRFYYDYFFQTCAKLTPQFSNWQLYSAILAWETGSPTKVTHVDLILRLLDNWYIGDGIYADGSNFTFDYYNSIAIHPLLLYIYKYVVQHLPKSQRLDEMETAFYMRWFMYAEILERMITADGHYPLIGRSLTYRFGVFHHLAVYAVESRGNARITSCVIEALTRVISNFKLSEIVDPKDGLLCEGLYYPTTALSEPYINRGSLYMCCTIFCVLGFSGKDTIWNSTKTFTELIIDGSVTPFKNLL